MKIGVIFFGGSLCANLVTWEMPGLIELEFKPKGRATEGGPSLTEFMNMAQRVVKQSVRSVNFTASMCNKYLDPRSYGSIPCSGVSAGNYEKAVRKSIDFPLDYSKKVYSPTTKLHSLLYLVEGDAVKASNLINSGIDFATAVLDQHAQCDIAFHPVEALAATIIGPGAVSISEAHARAVTHGWRVGAKASLSTSALVPVGSLDIGISVDYQGSIARTTSKTVRRDFKANLGSTCTPSLLRVSAFCKSARAHVLYGKNTEVVSEHITTIQAKLLPNDANQGEFFTSILGCIDYSQ